MDTGSWVVALVDKKRRDACKGGFRNSNSEAIFSQKELESQQIQNLAFMYFIFDPMFHIHNSVSGPLQTEPKLRFCGRIS